MSLRALALSALTGSIATVGLFRHFSAHEKMSSHFKIASKTLFLNAFLADLGHWKFSMLGKTRIQNSSIVRCQNTFFSCASKRHIKSTVSACTLSSSIAPFCCESMPKRQPSHHTLLKPIWNQKKCANIIYIFHQPSLNKTGIGVFPYGVFNGPNFHLNLYITTTLL